ncbi:undecaprenyl-diphosphate phosphatase [Natranaerobius trueperi]|uniref:Undecaprenyl-diphosphatase n=1 Tax=Natranaerobius trueperi TaxID=759412 RepID=A0A226BZ74_9FIRM|nr:undecaprenyl-diphosphate phosphatase [Natranaerobius trueperi]OWZ83430.1 hypothetical protein CDO51_08545 [Natranaerobius trueperi]
MFEMIILGIIQGITEFLPVSSSAHLVIGEKIMGLEIPGLYFEVILHLASLFALIVYFNSEVSDLLKKSIKYMYTKSTIYEQTFRFFKFLLYATIVTGVIGVCLESILDDQIKDLTVTGAALLITGILLIYIENSKKAHFIFLNHDSDLTFKNCLVIGAFQGLSIIPGLSRSGMTVIGGLLQGYSKSITLKISFLLAFPVIIGSFIYKLPELILTTNSSINLSWNQIIISFITCFLASLVGIKGLIGIVKNNKLTIFAVYVIVLGIMILIVS